MNCQILNQEFGRDLEFIRRMESWTKSRSHVSSVEHYLSKVASQKITVHLVRWHGETCAGDKDGSKASTTAGSNAHCQLSCLLKECTELNHTAHFFCLLIVGVISYTHD